MGAREQESRVQSVEVESCSLNRILVLDIDRKRDF
jgi:hypothetical protein